MSPNPRAKFAVLSHVLPPSPSGQAMMLGYLLSTFDPDEYCLISTAAYPPDAHAAAYYHLVAGRRFVSPLLRRLPGVNADKQTPFHRALRPLLKIYQHLRGDYPLSEARLLEDRMARELRDILEREHCYALVACTGIPQEMLAARRACQATGAAFVPYIFDYFGLKHTGEMGAYARRHEAALLQSAAAILVTNEFMAEEYRRLYGVESAILRNPCRPHDLDQLDSTPRVLPVETFNIVYTGAVYSAHYDAFRNLIAAVESLGRAGQSRADVAIHVYTAQLPMTLHSAGLKAACFHIHEHVEHEAVAALQRQADVLFLPLAFESPIPETIKTSSPGKLGEYLSMGRPILVHAPQDSFLSWYFRTHACGLVVDDHDPAVLADALARLLADADLRAELGAQARAQAAEFALETVGPRFRAALEERRMPFSKVGRESPLGH